MFLFSKKDTKKESDLIIEIQSSVIRASIVTIKSNNNSEVLFSTIRNINRHEHTKGHHLVKLMLQAVTSAVEEISHKKSHFSRVRYVLYSPWVVLHSKIVETTYDKDTEITEKIINDIVKDDYKNLIDSVGKDVDLSLGDDDIKCVEQKIFDIKLNGYSVSSYKGKKAKSLEISFVSTLGSSRTLNKLHTVTTHFLHVKDFDIHSSPILLFSAMRNTSEDFISLDIHGESTDIIISSRGLCVYSGSIRYGSHNLLKDIAKDLKKEIGTVNSSIALMYSQKLDESEASKIQKSIDTVFPKWSDDLSKILDNMKKKNYLPKTLYLSSMENDELFVSKMKDFKVSGIGFDVVKFDNMPMYILALENML